MKLYLFLALNLLSAVVVAQMSVSVIGTDLVDPSIAISSRDNNQIVIGAGPDKVYYTEDAGNSWNEGKISSTLEMAGNPVVVVDKKGRFYYFHHTKDGSVATQLSKDGGMSWMEQGSFVEGSDSKHYKPGVTLDSKGRLMVAWTQAKNLESGGQSDIMLGFSSNGAKWSNTTKLNKAPGTCCDTDQTALGANPVVYEDERYFITWAQGGKIFLDRSLDGGKFWLKNEGAVMEQPGGWNFDIPGLAKANGLPSFMVFYDPKGYFNGRLLLMWSDQKNGPENTDIWFAYSDNRGDSFQPALKVNDDDSGRHQFHPALTIDQSTGRIYILYYDRRNSTDLKTEVYLAYSEDGGRSFQNKLISQSAFDLPESGVSLGDYIGVSAAGGKVAAAWTVYDEGRTEIRAAVFDHDELEK